MKKAIAGVMMTLMLSTTTQASFLGIDWRWKHIKSPISNITAGTALITTIYFIIKNNVSDEELGSYQSCLGLIIGGTLVHKVIDQFGRLAADEDLDDDKDKQQSENAAEEKYFSEADFASPLDKEKRQLGDNFFTKCQKYVSQKSMKIPSKEALRDLREARDTYKKLCEDRDERVLLDLKNSFKEFKETQCKHITKEQQKDLEDAYNKYIGDWKASGKAYCSWIDAMYESTRLKRKFLKDRTFASKYKLGKDYKRHEAIGKAFDISMVKLKTSHRLFLEKAKEVSGKDFYDDWDDGRGL